MAHSQTNEGMRAARLRERNRKNAVKGNVLRYLIHGYCSVRNWSVDMDETLAFMESKGHTLSAYQLRKLCTQWGFRSRLRDSLYPRRVNTDGKPLAYMPRRTVDSDTALDFTFVIRNTPDENYD